MPKKTDNHVHKLKRHTYKGGTQVYFCILDCPFKIEAPFALGKQTICHICGEEFTMNEYSVKLSRPHCKACGRMRVKEPDGSLRFVNKSRANEAITEMNEVAVSSLRDRLSKVVMIDPEPVIDEDI